MLLKETTTHKYPSVTVLLAVHCSSGTVVSTTASWLVNVVRSDSHSKHMVVLYRHYERALPERSCGSGRRPEEPGHGEAGPSEEVERQHLQSKKRIYIYIYIYIYKFSPFPFLISPYLFSSSLGSLPVCWDLSRGTEATGICCWQLCLTHTHTHVFTFLHSLTHNHSINITHVLTNRCSDL